MRRRDFLSMAAVTVGLGASFRLGRQYPSAWPWHATPSAKLGEGTLYGLGFGGKRHPQNFGAPTSVITLVNLLTGSVQQGILDLANGHFVLPDGTGGGLCLPLDGGEAVFVDAKLRVRSRLPAPPGYVFSGHGVALSQQDRLAYVSLRRRHAQTFADTGKIALVNLENGRMLGLIDSGGVRPHDMVLFDGGRKMAVSHYGDLSPSAPLGQRRQPRLVIFDVTKAAMIRVIDTPPEGTLTHIAAAADGTICGVPLNYHNLDRDGIAAIGSRLGDAAWEVSVAEELEGRAGDGMPLFMINSHTGSVRSLGEHAAKQRRAQSVAYHPQAGAFFVTFAFSDVVARIEQDTVRYVSGFDLGLNCVRGVCAIPNTPYVAVGGEFRGLAIIDAATMAVVRRLDVSWFDHAHLSWG